MAHYLIYTDVAYFPEHERSSIAYVMLGTFSKQRDSQALPNGERRVKWTCGT